MCSKTSKTLTEADKICFKLNKHWMKHLEDRAHKTKTPLSIHVHLYYCHAIFITVAPQGKEPNPSLLSLSSPIVYLDKFWTFLGLVASFLLFLFLLFGIAMSSLCLSYYCILEAHTLSSHKFMAGEFWRLRRRCLKESFGLHP